MITRLIFLIGITAGILPNAGNAQSFGKIFSTAQERQYLDREREESLRVLSEQERLDLLDTPPTVQEIIESAPTLIHMGGSIKRADGNHTVWLNGVSISQKELPANVSLRFERGLGELYVQGSNQLFIIKPGQTLNADTGEVREDYELTEVEVEEVVAEVAARAEAARVARISNSTKSPDASSEENTQDENKSMIENIFAGLQLLQEARSVQEEVQ